MVLVGAAVWASNRMYRRRLIQHLLMGVIVFCLITWVTYRLKQPHRRVRALIKHPYHLFAEDQFGERDVTCYPDSREEEAALLGKLDEQVLKEVGDDFSVSNRSSPEQVLTVNFSKLLALQTKAQVVFCEGLDEAKPANVLIFSSSHSATAFHVLLRTIVAAFMLALMSGRAFVIASPQSVALEKAVRVAQTGKSSFSVDWRPISSGCKSGAYSHIDSGLEQATDGFSLPVPVRQCQRSIAHATNSSVPSVRMSNGFGSCQRDVLARLGKATSITEALLPGIVFPLLFSLPSDVEWLVDTAEMSFISSQPPVQLRQKALQTAPLTTKRAICFDLDQVGTSKELLGLWHCARFLEKATKWKGDVVWLLIGEGEQGMTNAAAQTLASHYLNCSELTKSHSLISWNAPSDLGPEQQQMTYVSLLSRCHLQVGLSRSGVSQLAAIVARRPYMGADSSKKGKDTNLHDVCHKEIGLWQPEST